MYTFGAPKKLKPNLQIYICEYARSSMTTRDTKGILLTTITKVNFVCFIFILFLIRSTEIQVKRRLRLNWVRRHYSFCFKAEPSFLLSVTATELEVNKYCRIYSTRTVYTQTSVYSAYISVHQMNYYFIDSFY